MADNSGVSIPQTDNWNEWKFEHVLKAITNEGADLHTPAASNKWFTWVKDPGPNSFYYHAWDVNYYVVDTDVDNLAAWNAAVDLNDEMMPDVARGHRGSMDFPSVMALSAAIGDFTIWNQTVGGGMDRWATNLNSDDSSFKGKAAFLIYWRLKVAGDGLRDIYEQLTTRHGEAVFATVAEAAEELARLNATLSSQWQISMSAGLRGFIQDLIDQVKIDVNKHLLNKGLVKGQPGYVLDDQYKYYLRHSGDKGRSRGKVEQYIRDSLDGYFQGSLRQPARWEQFNQWITDTTLTFLDGTLDIMAQKGIAALAPKYIMASTSLMDLTPPPPETPPTPDDPNGGGGGGDNNTDLPPPPDGGGGGGDNNTDLPPPPDGGGGGGDGLNLDGGGGGGGGGGDGLNLPGGDGGGGNGLNLPGGDGGGGNGLNLPGGDGGGGNGLNVPGGGGANELGLPNDGGGDPANGGAPGFIPGLTPPGGGTDGNGGPGKNGTGPGADGAFNENGLGNDLVKPPAGDGNGFSILPDGSGQSNTHVPPGGTDGGGTNGLNLGKPPKGGAGADGGLNIGPGGFGSDPGKGFGSGADLLGTNGGAGNPLGGLGGPGGGLGNSGLNNVPNQVSGGTPGLNGTPGSSGDGSGVPFFPPMMGGGGAGMNGEKPQERERQTWLLEDEEIWGTRVNVRSGAIGRLEEEFEGEELPLVGPTRRQRRAETPRRPRPDEKRDPKSETTSSEEATGSA